MHCVRRGASVTAIPVVWRDRPGTTFSVRRHTAECLFDLARIRGRAGRPRPIRTARATPSTSAPGASAPEVSEAGASGAGASAWGRSAPPPAQPASPLVLSEGTGAGPG
jgi:hypothetical protein